MRSEMEDDEDYIWTEEDFKRASAPTRMDFVRFNAMWQYDFNGGSLLMSREQFADAMYETARDVGVPEKLKKLISEISDNNKKEKKKVMLKKGYYDEEDNKEKLKKIEMKEKNMMLRETYYDPEDPKVQAEMDDKFKEFERRLMLLQHINKHLGPAAADAAAIAALEAEDPLASLAQAAAKALPPN